MIGGHRRGKCALALAFTLTSTRLSFLASLKTTRRGMCGVEDKNRHDKSLVEDKFHVELVVENRKIEGLDARRWRVVRTEVCQTSLRILESFEN
jgi:hypothetical protein